MAGCSNKKAVEWDVRAGQIVQEYDEHLGTVNSITFAANGKNLVTTADDKKILIWEYGIPVVVKYIADPLIHSIPTVDPHYTSSKFCSMLLRRVLGSSSFLLNLAEFFPYGGHSLSVRTNRLDARRTQSSHAAKLRRRTRARASDLRAGSSMHCRNCLFA